MDGEINIGKKETVAELNGLAPDRFRYSFLSPAACSRKDKSFNFRMPFNSSSRRRPVKNAGKVSSTTQFADRFSRASQWIPEKSTGSARYITSFFKRCSSFTPVISVKSPRKNNSSTSG